MKTNLKNNIEKILNGKHTYKFAVVGLVDLFEVEIEKAKEDLIEEIEYILSAKLNLFPGQIDEIVKSLKGEKGDK